ncbi:MAG: phosphatidylglycerol lysyltransferase domain-containing protein [Candidatus Omnitrophota bacterium]
MQKLTLKDQKLFNQYLNLTSHDLAVYSFANIYIWKCLYDIRWEIIENSLCLFFQDKIGVFMYLPPLAREQKPKVIRESFAIMDRINKNKDISRIENIEAGDLEYYRVLGYLCHEKYPDYLCLRDDLVNLKGNKFKSQRAAFNYFTKHYNFDCSKLKLSDRASVLNLFNFWLEQRKAGVDDDIFCGMLEDSRKVIKVALANYKQLNLSGMVIRINKTIKAFSFGYKINQGTFCILYEITDLSIKGLAQFIFCKFSAQLEGYKNINIMDDSGLENLRKTKLAYKPVRLIPAFIAIRDA